MRIRTGFVSNSSAASFIISKNSLTQQEVYAIMAYPLWGQEQNGDGWSIKDDGENIKGFTPCDNGYLTEYLKNFGISIPNECWSDLS